VEIGNLLDYGFCRKDVRCSRIILSCQVTQVGQALMTGSAYGLLRNTIFLCLQNGVFLIRKVYVNTHKFLGLSMIQGS